MDQIGHLSIEQLRDLAAGRTPIDDSHPDAVHLVSCPACQRMLAMSRRTAEASQKLQDAGLQPLTDMCLSTQQIGELATGIAAPDLAPAWLTHASACDHCGTALRSAIQDLSAHPEPAGQDIAPSPTPENPPRQENLAREMARRKQPRRRNPWIPLTIAASLAVAALAGWRVLPSYRASRVETLLAQAYTHQRPFDFRLPDDGYAPVTQLHAGAVSAFDRPEALLSAQARLAAEKAATQSDARWLRMRAGAELLDLNPEAAIAALTRARELAPQNKDIIIDLAIAHAIRGDAESHPVDYATALDLLSEALRLDPNSTRALFNRGLVFDRLLLLDEAIQDFRKYVELDNSGGWADEVRRRLHDLEQRRAGREARGLRRHFRKGRARAKGTRNARC